MLGPGGFLDDGYDSDAFETGGFWVPTVPPESISGVNHTVRAFSRLPEQFKSRPGIVNLLSTLCVGFVSLEDALYQLLTLRSVATAEGAQLDVLGQIVGQPRDGLGDAVYRRYIRARIAANRSKGRGEDLVRVARLVLDDPSSTVEVETQAIATAVVRLGGPGTTDELAGIVVEFLRDSVAAGVRLLLESTTDTDDESFNFAGAAFTVTGTIALGASSIIVEDLEDPSGARLAGWFPPVGTVVIDQGTVDEEFWPYNGVVDNTNGTRTLFSSTPFSKAHSSGSLAGIAVQPSTFPGEGFGTSGDFNQPTLTPYGTTGADGGRLADVRE